MRRFFFVSLLLATPVFAQQLPPPPPEAKSACEGQSQGQRCEFIAPHGKVSGQCREVREGLLCVPDRMPPMLNRSNQRNDQRNKPPKRAKIDIDATTNDAEKTTSRIPDTNQGSCFDNHQKIPCPPKDDAFYGQDAHYAGATPSYTQDKSGTVTDNVTGLMWQQAHNPQRINWYQANQACESLTLAGFTDWRLPSIKELFSIIDFRGVFGQRAYLPDEFDIRPPASLSKNDPFAANHRPEMMGQTWSATKYAGQHWDDPNVEAAFFVNFLDGRIKQAPTRGREGLFYRCVRGPAWGENQFVDNNNGTVSDKMSDLMWQQQDDGETRNWQEALNYCNGLTLAGHTDWRLPNVKELQSIVNYQRPAPAIDTASFGVSDPAAWYWSSTTHGDDISQADYVCFGKCTSVQGIDVHGAGAQRSDPKLRGVRVAQQQGGQQDEIRIENLVRCVR